MCSSRRTRPKSPPYRSVRRCLSIVVEAVSSNDGIDLRGMTGADEHRVDCDTLLRRTNVPCDLDANLSLEEI